MKTLFASLLNTSLRTLGLGAALVWASACSDSSTPSAGDESDTDTDLPSSLEVVIQDAVENTIVPDIITFQAAAESMQADVEGFCEAIGPDTLDDVQASWKALSEAWNAVAGYNVGPLDDDVVTPKIIFIESMRLRGTDYTETVRFAATEAISSTEPLDDDFFNRSTFNKVGLLALEVLIFEDTREAHSNDPADIVSDYEAQPRKCEYLRGVMGLLTRHATEVRDGWTVAFGDTGEAFKDTMLEPELADGSEPIAALLIALQEHLDYLQVRKLEGTLDAQLSGHFYPNVRAGLEAFERLLVQPMPEESVGILDFMQEHDYQAEADLVTTNLEMAKAAITQEDREALTAAIGLLDGNLKREIPDGLDVNLGITFSDGD